MMGVRMEGRLALASSFAQASVRLFSGGCVGGDEDPQIPKDCPGQVSQ